MASVTETVYWPVAVSLGFVFIIAMAMILGQLQNQVNFHTATEISKVSSQSFLYTFLYARSSTGSWDPDVNNEFTNYEKISYNYCGKSHNLDWDAWNHLLFDYGWLKWIKIEADIPSVCGGGTETRTYGQEGKDEKFKHEVKIPTRGGGVVDLAMHYEPRY